MPVTRSVLDTRYIHLPVRTVKSGVVVDPTADANYFAFFLDETLRPGISDWVPGDWETARVGAVLVYFARTLIGPGVGGRALAVGHWWVWSRITDNPEAPVEQVDWIEIV
jgi:hypothetical protein